jgi:hypothetical protein
MIGSMHAFFNATASAVTNTRARWSNTTGSAAQITTRLVHNLNAYMPDHASWTAEHTLKVDVQTVQGYDGNDSDYAPRTITSVDENTIDVVWYVGANEDLDASLFCARLHSKTR